MQLVEGSATRHGDLPFASSECVLQEEPDITPKVNFNISRLNKYKVEISILIFNKRRWISSQCSTPKVSMGCKDY